MVPAGGAEGSGWAVPANGADVSGWMVPTGVAKDSGWTLESAAPPGAAGGSVWTEGSPAAGRAMED